MRLVQVAVRREEERVAGESAGQHAGCNFALLLKDYVGESAAIDGQGDG